MHRTVSYYSKNYAVIPALMRSTFYVFSFLFRLAKCKEMCCFSFPTGCLLSMILAIE